MAEEKIQIYLKNGESISEGQRISHPKFGSGKVLLMVTASGEGPFLYVEFDERKDKAEVSTAITLAQAAHLYRQNRAQEAEKLLDDTERNVNASAQGFLGISNESKAKCLTAVTLGRALFPTGSDPHRVTDLLLTQDIDEIIPAGKVIINEHY